MKRVAILQSNYLPWKGYFDIIKNVDLFIFLDCVQYTKNDWRNRNIIPSKTGVFWLTVPIKRENLTNKLISEAHICNKINWQSKHKKALQHNYSKQPYYQEIAKLLSDAFDIEWKSLSSLNQHLIKNISNYLDIKTQIICAENIIPNINNITDPNQRLVQLIEEVSGTHYLSGPSAKSYLDLELFKNHKLEVGFIDYSRYPIYKQSTREFRHGVSIVDLLFMFGKSSASYIWQ